MWTRGRPAAAPSRRVAPACLAAASSSSTRSTSACSSAEARGSDLTGNCRRRGAASSRTRATCAGATCTARAAASQASSSAPRAGTHPAIAIASEIDQRYKGSRTIPTAAPGGRSAPSSSTAMSVRGRGRRSQIESFTAPTAIARSTAPRCPASARSCRHPLGSSRAKMSAIRLGSPRARSSRPWSTMSGGTCSSSSPSP